MTSSYNSYLILNACVCVLVNPKEAAVGLEISQQTLA